MAFFDRPLWWWEVVDSAGGLQAFGVSCVGSHALYHGGFGSERQQQEPKKLARLNAAASSSLAGFSVSSASSLAGSPGLRQANLPAQNLCDHLTVGLSGGGQRPCMACNARASHVERSERSHATEGSSLFGCYPASDEEDRPNITGIYSI